MVLDRLLENGIKMVLASDADAEIMEQELVKYDLNKYFIGKCISSSVRAYKPTLGFIKHLKKYIDIRENCYFVGDSNVDVESAKGLGIKSVLVDRAGEKSHIKADYRVRDLKELLPILNVE